MLGKNKKKTQFSENGPSYVTKLHMKSKPDLQSVICHFTWTGDFFSCRFGRTLRKPFAAREELLVSPFRVSLLPLLNDLQAFIWKEIQANLFLIELFWLCNNFKNILYKWFSSTEYRHWHQYKNYNMSQQQMADLYLSGCPESILGHGKELQDDVVCMDKHELVP